MRHAMLAAALLTLAACSSEPDEPQICEDVFACVVEAGTPSREDLYQAMLDCHNEDLATAEERCADEKEAHLAASEASTTTHHDCVGLHVEPQSESEADLPEHTPEYEAAYRGLFAGRACNNVDFFGADMALYFGDHDEQQALCEAACD